MRIEFLCISVLRVASGPRVKLVGCKSALTSSTVSSQKMAKRLSKIKVSPRHTMQCEDIQRQIVNHSRSTALERAVKYYWGWRERGWVGGGGGAGGWGLNRFYIAKTLALSPAVVHIKHLFSPRECFLFHQCNISENIKIKQIQRWNNHEDSTARNNWNAEAKENQ